MRRVVVESPYSGDVARNLRYLRAAMRDCLQRGEAPFASHGLYTQEGVLRDSNLSERALGIKAGFAWRPVAAATVIYVDLGVTPGMDEGIVDALSLLFQGHAVEVRRLGPNWDRE